MRSSIDENLIKKLGKGSGIAGVGRLIGKGANFLLQVVLTRFLGVASYGLYTLGFSVITLLKPFASLGAERGVLRFVSMFKKDTAKTKGVLVSGIIIILISSILLSFCLFYFSDLIAVSIFHSPEIASILRLFALSLPFYMFMLLAAQAVRALNKISYYVGLINITHPFSQIVLTCLFFILGWSVKGVVTAFLGSVIISAFFGFYFLYKAFPEICSKVKSVYQTKRVLRYSLPLVLAGLAWLMAGKIDRLMLGYFRSPSEVGIYNAAAILSVQLLFLVDSFNVSFAPLSSELIHKDQLKKLEDILKTGSRWIFTISLPIILLLAFFAEDILGLFFGADFVKGSWVLIILLFGFLFNICGAGLAGIILQMKGKQDLILIDNLIMLGINLALNFWLIPLYGMEGAAIATSISMIFISLLRILQVRSILNIHPLSKRYLKPLGAGLLDFIMLVLVANMWINVDSIAFLFVSSLIYLGIYFSLLLSWGLDKRDRIVLEVLKVRTKKVLSI